MPRFFSAFLFTLAPSLLLPARAESQEPALQSAGAAYAPLDVGKNAPDPSVPLTASQRKELLGEFKGLVHMGLYEVPYETWGGKEMADCDQPQNRQDAWTYRCEITTGQGDGTYYFFPNKLRHTSTLRELDIQVHGSDERLLEDFKRPVQDLFGRASLVDKTIVQAKPTGLIRRWSNEGDIAELFMDRSVRPQGSVRFIWMRPE